MRKRLKTARVHNRRRIKRANHLNGGTFFTCIIDALEKRGVATTDIPGAFMQADMGEIVNMKIEGEIAQLMTKIDPKKYEKYTVMEKGKQVIYVRLLKALYGTLKSALLFWENLSETLQEWGFNSNPYDWCVANKMINDQQWDAP